MEKEWHNFMETSTHHQSTLLLNSSPKAHEKYVSSEKTCNLVFTLNLGTIKNYQEIQLWQKDKSKAEPTARTPANETALLFFSIIISSLLFP